MKITNQQPLCICVNNYFTKSLEFFSTKNSIINIQICFETEMLILLSENNGAKFSITFSNSVHQFEIFESREIVLDFNKEQFKISRFRIFLGKYNNQQLKFWN